MQLTSAGSSRMREIVGVETVELVHVNRLFRTGGNSLLLG